MANLPNSTFEIGQSSSSATTDYDWIWDCIPDQDFPTDLTLTNPSSTTQDGTTMSSGDAGAGTSVLNADQRSVVFPMHTTQDGTTMSSGGAGSSSSILIAGQRSVVLPTRSGNPRSTTQDGTTTISGGAGNTIVNAGQRSVVLPMHTLPLPPVLLPNYDIDVRGLHFLFEKQLKPSDVSSLGRIIIPKREAEACLPRLEDKEGILLKVHDIDHVRVWIFRFRFWPNNGSRMYLFENTMEYVKAHNLVSGDFALLYIDRRTGFYYIRAQKESEIPMLETTRTVERDQDSFPRGSLDIEVYAHNSHINFPTMEEELTEPPFLFDTTLTNDHILVCTKLDPLPEIGSTESISFDDFL